MTVGERIKHLRLKSNLTQEELGKRCGEVSAKEISASTIRKYELGILKNPKADTIRIIAAALGVSEFELQGITTQKILNSLSETTAFYNYLHALGYEVHESPYNDKWIIKIKDSKEEIYISSEELDTLECTTQENIDLRITKYVSDGKHKE